MPTDPKPNYRYERKFHTSSLFRENVINIIKLHPANFSVSYPDRNVNNIYLDSADFDCFTANVDGASSRFKYRIRWYGETLGYIRSPVLEVKSKDNLVGTKESYPLSAFNLDKNFTTKLLNQILTSAQLPPLLGTSIPDYRPVLLNGYRRKYFESFDKHFRLTVDDDLHFRPMKTVGNKYFGKSNDSESIIVELKYGLRDTAEYYDIANYLKLRMTKNSKYVTGIFELYG